MREEEIIGDYLLCVDEVVNVIRGLGGKLRKRSGKQDTKSITNEI